MHISFAVLVECNMKQKKIGTSHASDLIYPLHYLKPLNCSFAILNKNNTYNN